MKLTELGLVEFRSHKKTGLKGLGRVNVILGANGSGKSTILDGIQYALTGVCRGVNKQGAGAKHLINRDSKDAGFRVSLKVGKEVLSRGLGEGPKASIQARIEGKLGCDWDMISNALSPTSFFHLSPSQQRDLILSVTGESVDAKVLEGILGDAVGYIPAHLKPEDTIDAEWADQLEKDLRKVRPELKRTISDLVIPDTNGLDEDEVKGSIADANASLVEARQERDTALRSRADLDARRDIANSQLKLAQQTLAGIEEAGKQGSKASVKKSLKLCQAKAKDMEKRESDRVEAEMKCRSEIATVESLLVSLRDQHNEANTVGGECQACGQNVTKSQKASYLNSIAKKGKSAASKKKTLLKKLDSYQAGLEQSSILDNLHGQIKELEKALETGDGLKQKKAEAEITVKEAQKVLDQTEVPAEINVQELDEDIKAGEEYLAEKNAMLSKFAEVELARKQRLTIQERIDAYDLIIRELSGKGRIRASLMSDALGDFLKEVGGHLTELGLSPISLGHNEIIMDEAPISLLSKSEQYRLAMVLAGVLSKRAGLGMICLDDAEVLDATNAEMFNEVLDVVGIDQAFVASVKDEAPEGLESDDEWSFYFVDKKDGISAVTRL